MEHSSSQSFTGMMNSPIPPSDSQNSYSMQNPQNPSSLQHQNLHPSHISMNYPHPNQYNPNFQPYYPQHVNQYGAQVSYQQFSPSSYHGVAYHGNVGQYPPGAFGAGSSSSPTSPVGCMPFLEAFGGTSSRGDKSSPIAVGSPMLPAVNNEEGSESSSDEIEKKGKGKNWSKHEDELLIAAWVHNLVDSIDGISKRAENYWSQVAAEFNKYATKEQQKTIMQCKNHWTKTTKKVTKFNVVYNAKKSMWPSDCDDNQLMERVRAKYKSVANTKRPFAYEHWWKLVKTKAKWRRSYSVQEMNKRNKLNASGAYSSPSEARDQEGELQRPMGHNKVKAQQKSTSKSKCSTGSFTSESVDQFNEIQLRKLIAAKKMADATLIQAEATKIQAKADKGRVEAEKEQIKVEKLNRYLDLFAKDTSGYDDAQKKRYEQVVEYLSRELFG